MANIQITVDGIDEFNRTFDRIDAAFDDLRPIWPDVRTKFFEIEKEQFGTEGTAGRSGKFAPLTKRYAIAKVKRYGNMKILVATGQMMRSLTGPNDYAVYRPAKTQVEIGTSDLKALFHQRGTRHMPSRPPINFSLKQQAEMMKAIQSALIRELRKGSGYVPASDR